MAISGINGNIPSAFSQGAGGKRQLPLTRERQAETRKQQFRQEQKRQQREAAREAIRQAKKELPRAFRESLEFGVVEPTDEMFKRVVDTQTNETIKVQPPVFMLKQSVNVLKMIGRFLDQKA